MGWTALPEVPWGTVFAATLWSIVLATVTVLLASAFASVVLSLVDARGRGEGH
jgi:hypothetical protein